MEVKTVTRYQVNGKEFNSLKDVQDYAHNIIGEEVIDVIDNTIGVHHKDLFKLLDILCKKEVREALIKAYSITHTFDVGDFDTYGESIMKTATKNILDYDFKKK